MVRGFIAAVLLIVAGPAQAAEVDIYEHNGSVIEWAVAATNDVRAIYATPRPGLEAAGVKPGTVFFEGTYENDRIVGKAYAFKPGCPPAGYEVIGREDGKRIVLDGPGPRRDPKGCAVLGYYANSPHAHLVLTFSAHHH